MILLQLVLEILLLAVTHAHHVKLVQLDGVLMVVEEDVSNLDELSLYAVVLKSIQLMVSIAYPVVTMAGFKTQETPNNVFHLHALQTTQS